jgi:hypothetical protein
MFEKYYCKYTYLYKVKATNEIHLCLVEKFSEKFLFLLFGGITEIVAEKK